MDALRKAGAGWAELVNPLADQDFTARPAVLWFRPRLKWPFEPVLLSVLSPVPNPILWTPLQAFGARWTPRDSLWPVVFFGTVGQL
jgi:hypothetical protein